MNLIQFLYHPVYRALLPRNLPLLMVHSLSLRIYWWYVPVAVQSRQAQQILAEAAQRGRGRYHLHQRAESCVQQEDRTLLRQVHIGDSCKLRARDSAIAVVLALISLSGVAVVVCFCARTFSSMCILSRLLSIPYRDPDALLLYSSISCSICTSLNYSALLQSYRVYQYHIVPCASHPGTKTVCTFGYLKTKR